MYCHYIFGCSTFSASGVAVFLYGMMLISKYYSTLVHIMLQCMTLCVYHERIMYLCALCITHVGVLEVSTALPVPTLSQAPLTQFTQQQDHPPPVPSSQPSTVTSILAPDSQVSSQSSAQSMPKHLKRGVSKEGSSSSSATSDVMVKVDETGHSQRQVKSSRYVW